MADNGDHDDLHETDYGDDSLAADETYDDTLGDGDTTADISTADDQDQELEAIKARVREMEEEAEKLKEMQNEVEKQMSMGSAVAKSPSNVSVEEKIEVDSRSIYVGNVDYAATAEELESHFHGCGSVNRVTIMCDKFSGHPKGFAFVEFQDKDSVNTAMSLDESLFRGRQIKVTAKRTNRPGISTTDRGRGRGGRGRGRGFYGGGGYGYRGGRGRGFRGRGRGWYQPY